MISLIGIVSGLLAREVIDSIAGQGRKFFQANDGNRTDGEGSASKPAEAKQCAAKG